MKKEDERLVLKRLNNTGRCRREVEQTAISLSDLSIKEYEELITNLIDNGDDKTVGILLNVCAVNKIRLDPEILARTLKVVEPITDFAFPFCMQDQSAIEPLLSIALAEDISWERQAFAARLAAELSVRYHSDRKPVKKVVIKISHEYLSHEANLLNMETLALLELEDIPDDVPWLTRQDVLKTLPKEKAPVVVGGSYSVRRSVPKLGRNAPCHCGSGKKYKKCCIEKDQALMRDASPYEGLTMTELRSRPDLVDDTVMIEDMRAYELEKLEQEKLSSKQLFAAYRRAFNFGLRDLAFKMLCELEGRTDTSFDKGHFDDLINSALKAEDIELAMKIRDHVPEDSFYDPEAIEFHFQLLENKTFVASLEARCREALIHTYDAWNDPLNTLSRSFENKFPSLSLVFARASLISNPDSIFEDAMFDNESLQDMIYKARIELDLDPWGDPVDNYLDWALTKNELDIEDDVKSREIEELKEKVEKAKHLADQRLTELRTKELELDRFSKKLDQEKAIILNKPQVNEGIAETSGKDRKTIAKLRQRIEDLKIDISSGQQERRHLRKKIKDEQLKTLAQQRKKEAKKNDSSESETAIAYENAPKRILIPEFTGAFQRSCKSMPGSIVAKSLNAASGFATHDRLIWRQTKGLEGLSGFFSIRIGIHHRLLIRWERNIRLEVLDLIQREQLKTWIKQNGGSRL